MMKKVFIVLTVMAATFAACNSGESKKSTPAASATEAKEEPKSANPDYDKGLALEAKQNCYTCHEIENKKIGPAYREIAAKYATYSDTIVTHLAKKVITGGQGVWGEVPMAAHPELSQADAEAIVKYILLLKK